MHAAFLLKQLRVPLYAHYAAVLALYGLNYAVWRGGAHLYAAARLPHGLVMERVHLKPFAVAEQFTGVKGVMVSIEDTIKGFNMILDGEVDDLPEQAFLNVGTIEDAIAKGKKLLEAAKG